MSELTYVRELERVLPEDRHSRTQTQLGQVRIAQDGTTIKITPMTESGAEAPEDQIIERPFDEVGVQTLARHLDINYKYLSDCPAALRAQNFNHWLTEADDAEAVFAYDSQGVDSVYSPDKIVLPVRMVGGVISNVFDPDDEIPNFRRDDDHFLIDIVKPDLRRDIPGNGIGDRPAEGVVGDITNAGVRIYVPTDFKKAKPFVTGFMNRLVCTNGLSLAQESDQISLKGMTVEDLIEEMEERAREVLDGMPAQLDRYVETASMTVPGNPVAFIRQVGRDHGFGPTIIDKALDYATGFVDMEWTVYDVLNIFTELANTARFTTSMKLQNFGGSMVHAPEEFLHRCTNCERPLPAHQHAH